MFLNNDDKIFILKMQISHQLPPYTHMANQLATYYIIQIWSHYKAETVDKLMDKHFYNEAVKDQVFHAVHVGLLCTQATPSYRPTMAKVVEMLRSTKDQVNVFPTDPPFLDILLTVDMEEGDGVHLLSGASASGFSGSSGSILYGR